MMRHSQESDVRLIRLSADDILRRSDPYRQFRDLVVSNEESYPGIAKWVDQKVASGIRSHERSAFIAFAGSEPIATAVVKRARESKFCHLRLSENVRDQNLGELFFTLMAAEVRGIASEIHFTLPESLWVEKRPFFEGFGFSVAVRADRQYRLFEEELRCTAPFAVVWKSVLQKLPRLGQRFFMQGHAMFSPLLLSVAPRHAERIFSGCKSVEVRRRFSTKWAGARSVVYASSPEKRILGEVSIASVIPDAPESIWNTFSAALGCTRAEFDAYVSGSDEVYALVLDDVVAYAEPIPLAQLEFLAEEDLMPPQSYCSLAGNKKWSKALAIAALLHGGSGSTAKHLQRQPTHITSGEPQMMLI